MAAQEESTSWSDGSTGSYVTEDDGTRSKRSRSRLEGYDTANMVWRRVKVSADGSIVVSATVTGTEASTVADGSDVAEGSTTDAAVVTDVSGTVSGKLRGLVKMWADVWDSSNHRLKVDGSSVTQPVSWAAAQHVIVDTAPSTVVTGPLTDTQLRATAVPVSGTVSANATLSAETTKVIGTVNLSSGQTVGLAAGSQVIGHVVVDTLPAVSVSNFPTTQIVDGSAAKDLTNTVPTGLTNNLVVRHASSLGGGSAVQAAFLATQVALQTQQISYTENIDGSIIVPPGGFLALLATATGVAHSAASSILWEEVLL